MREHIAAEIGKLRAELTIAKAHESGKLVDLPNPLVRKRNDGA